MLTETQRHTAATAKRPTHTLNWHATATPKRFNWHTAATPKRLNWHTTATPKRLNWHTAATPKRLNWHTTATPKRLNWHTTATPKRHPTDTHTHTERHTHTNTNTQLPHLTSIPTPLKNIVWLRQIGSSSQILGNIFKHVPNHQAVVDIFNVDHCGTCWKLPQLWADQMRHLGDSDNPPSVRDGDPEAVGRPTSGSLDRWTGWMETWHRKQWKLHHSEQAFPVNVPGGVPSHNWRSWDITGIYVLVGGAITILNDGVRQWEGWHPIHMKRKKMCETTNQEQSFPVNVPFIQFWHTSSYIRISWLRPADFCPERLPLKLKSTSFFGPSPSPGQTQTPSVLHV